MVVLTAASLAAVSGCVVDGERTENRPAASTSEEAHTFDPARRPTRLDCPTGHSPVITFDYGGDRRFANLLAAWTHELGRPYVDRERERIWFLRDDGTAHTVLDWTRATQPVDGRAWFVDGLESCRDSEQWKAVRAPSTPTELTRGSCWIEPIRIGEETWDFAEEELGVRHNRSLTLRGAVTPAGDVATYTDGSGHGITLVPSGSPWVVVREVCN